MIAFLKGRLAGKTTSTAYIEVGGVGYAVAMSRADLAQAGRDGRCGGRVLTYLSGDAKTPSRCSASSPIEEKALFETPHRRERRGAEGGPGGAFGVLAGARLLDAIASQDVARRVADTRRGEEDGLAHHPGAEGLARPGGMAALFGGALEPAAASDERLKGRHRGAAFHGLHLRRS